jgi:hypothetical protein
MPVDKALQWETESNAQMAQSAVRGMAQLNPDKAKSVLDSGKYDKYLSGSSARNSVELHRQCERRETS